MMLVNSGCDDRVLSKTNDRRTSNNNSDKTTRGILRSKSDRTSARNQRRIKKIVHFSGFFDLEEGSFVSEKCNDGKCRTDHTISSGPCSSALELRLQKYFWLPTEDELKWLVGEQCVHLESIRWFGRAITAVIRVKNLGYEKKIEILYTFDDWTTIYTVKGTYTDSPSPEEDRFSFCIFLPFLKLDLCIYFCIRYECCGLVYWDNYCGGNYKFVCRSNRTVEDDNVNRIDCSISSLNPFFDTNCSLFF